MADIVINPSVGKIDFFTNKGDQNPANTARLTGNTILFTGPLSASSISTGGGGAFVTSVQPTANYLSKFTGNSTIANSLIYDNGTNIGIGTSTPLSKLQINTTIAGSTVVRADGTSGTLFSVVDDLSDSLMSVNNSAGLPVFEVFADDRIVGGQYGKNDFVITNNRVGIGTSNPLAELHVTSSTSLPSAAFLGGNVGVGTTSPIYPLDIPAASALTRVGSALIGSWPTTTSLGMFGNSALDQTSAANYALLQSNQGITYLNAASGQSLRLRIANTDRLIIDSGGNVGIGTTSFVYGSANRGLVELYGSSESLIALRNSTGNLYIQKTSSDVYINNTNSGVMSFATNNTQRMVILAGGSVSFGSAADILGQPGNIYLNGNTGTGAGPALAFGQSDSVTGGIGHLARITGGGTSQDIFIQSQGASNSIGLNANPSGAAIYFQTQGAEKVRITAAGNVGIGTSTPATKLDIYGPVSVRGTTVLTTNFDLNAGNAADIYGNIRVLRGASLNDGMYIGYGGAGGNLKFFSNSGTTEFMTIATTGNVGIGSTSPAAKLDIAGTNTTIALSFGTTVPNNPLFINTYGSNTGIGMDQATAGLRLVGDYGGGTNPLTDIGYYAGGSVSHANWVSRFKVVNSGATVFTANVYHSIGSQRLFAGSGGTHNYIYTGTTMLNFVNAADTSTLMTLLNGGSVGIGTTSPAHKLEVLNTANSATYVRINNQNTGAAAYTGVDLQSYGGGWQVRVPASTTFANSLQFSFNDAERVRITSDGNVGIDTTSPNSKLDIRNGNLELSDSAFGNIPEIRFTGNSGGRYVFAGIKADEDGQFNGHLEFWTTPVSNNNTAANAAFAERMRITSAGLVGIGSTSPAYKLDVIGDARVSGGIFNASLSAQWIVNGGGTVTYNGSAILWSNRVIVIPVEKDELSTTGYIDINCPTSGTITYYNASNVTTTVTCAASGVPIAAWEALYYEITPGQGQASDQTKFRLVNYQNSTWRPSSNWILICALNGDSNSLKWIPGQVIIPNNGSFDSSNSTNNWQIAGTTNYVPKFTAANKIGNSVLYDNGTNIGIGTTSPAAKFQVGTHSTGDAGNGDNSANVRIGAASVGARVYGMTLANTATATLSNESALSFVLAGNYSATSVISAVLRSTVNAATDLVFTNYNGSLQERMRILYDGNVGIGTISPSTKLHIYENANRVTYISQNDNHTARFEAYGTATAIDTTASNGIFFRISGGDIVKFAADGNVGIGTSIATAPLHIYRASNPWIRLNGGGSFGYIRLDDGTSNGYLFKNTSSDTSNGALAGAMYTYTDNNKAFQHIHSGTPLFTILSNGNVGIGTSSPSTKLDVRGNLFVANAATGNNIIAFGNIGTLGPLNGAPNNLTGSAFLVVSSSTASGAPSHMKFFTTTGGVCGEKMRIAADGNIGIGTQSPAYKLDVNGGLNINGILSVAGVAVLNTATNANDIYANIRVIRNASSTITDGMYINYDSTGTTNAHLRFYANAGNERMRIDASSGNVGIGTTSPAYKLEVAGAIRSSFAHYNTSTDLNSLRGNLTTMGYSLTNTPSGAGWITVYTSQNNGGDIISQLAYDNYNQQKLFTRYSSDFGATWSAWKTIINSDAVSGTTNYVAKFTSANAVGNSLIFDNGTNVGIGTTSPISLLDVRSGFITAGTNSATSGTTIIAGYYTSGYLTSLGTEYSSGGPVLGYAVSPSTSATGAFLSSTTITIPRSAYTQDGGTHRWYTGAAQSVAIGSAVSTSERMRINSDGNLGIGVSTPRQILHINGSILLDGVDNGYTQGATRAIGYGSNSGAVNTDGFSGMDIQSVNAPAPNAGNYSQNLRFWTHHYGTGTGGTPRMVIQYNGNVGIGTTSPTQKLHVLTTGGSTTAPNIVATFQANTATTILAGGGTAIKFVGVSSGGNLQDYDQGMISTLGYAGNNQHGMQFWVKPNASTVLTVGQTIDNNGNVGIGSTSPIYKLDVNGTFRTTTNNLTIFNDYIYVSPTNNNTLNTAYNVNGIADMWINFRGYNDGQTQFRNFNVGNGKGENIAWFDGTNKRLSINNGQAASYTLDVNGTFNATGTSTLAAVSVSGTINSSATEAVRINNNNGFISFYNSAATTRTGYLQGNAGNDMLLASENGAVIRFAIGGSERVRIDTAGNVGIGTTTVRSTLHVNGDIIRDTNVPYSWSTSAPFRTFSGAYSYANGGVNGIARYLLLWPQITNVNGQNGRFVNARLVVSRGATHAYNDTTIGDVVASAGYNSSANLYSYTPIIGEKLYFYNIVYNSVTYLAISLPISDYRWELTGHYGIEETAYYSPTFVYANTSGIGTVTQLTDYTNESVAIYNKGGNIGINTTNPSQKLHVAGDALIASSATAGNLYFGDTSIYVRRDNSYDLSLVQAADSNSALYLASAGSIYLNIDSNNNDTDKAFIVQNNALKAGTELFRIQENGNVGIGTTSPGVKLHVNGGMTFGYGSNATFYTGTAFDASNYLILQNNTDSYGRVGLFINAKTFNGANTPSTNDGWSIDPRSGIRFRGWLSGDTDYDTKFVIQHLLANATNAVGDLGIFAKGYSTTLPAFVLAGGGNVGIGTSSPSNKLEVGNFLDAVTNKIIVSARYDYQPEFNFRLGQSGTNYDWIGGVISCGDDGNYNGIINFKTANAGRDTPTTKMVIKASGNVGIGTTSPLGKLHIYGFLRVGGAANEQTGIIALGNDANPVATYGDNGIFRGGIGSLGSANYLNVCSYQGIVFNVGNTGFGSQTTRMIIDVNGNVGIGTTSPGALLNIRASTPTGAAAAISGTNLQIDSNTSNYISFVNTADNGTYAGLVFTDNNNGGYIVFRNYTGDVTNGSDSLIYGTYQDHIFQTGTTSGVNSRNEVLRIKNSGYVGINTNNPTARLQVVQGNSGGVAAILLSSDESTIQGPSANTQIRMGSNLVLSAANISTISTNGSERVRIQSDGNVGIGTTSPIYKLQVVGSTYVNNGTLFIDSGNILSWGNSAQYILGTNGVGLTFVAGSATRMFVSSTGNVGIGTTTPSGQLHVNSTTAGSTIVRADGTNGTLFSVVDDLTDSLMSVNNSAGLPVFEVFADDRIVGGQYGANDFVITNNRVGIGTSNPLAELHVTGSATTPAALFFGNVGIGTTSFLYPTATRGLLEIYGSVDSIITLKHASTHAYFHKASNDFYLVNGGAGTISIYNNGSERMQINSSGNVGIGTTTVPSPLTIYNNADVWHFRLGSAAGELRFGGATNNGAVIQAYTPAGVVRDLYIQRDGGKVGIGTNSPNSPLTIVGDGTQNNVSGVLRVSDAGSSKWGSIGLPDVQSTTTAANNFYLIGRGGAFTDRVLSIHIPNTADYGSGAQPKFGVYSTGADLLASVEASTGTSYFKGNVGIGSASPSAKLDVVGSIKVSAKLIQNSTTVSVSGAGQTLTLNLDTAAVYVVSMASGATITTISYSNRDNNPSVNTLMLVVKYAGTASITFTNVIWANGATPTLTGTNGYADVFMLTSYQGGAGTPVWIGTVVAQALVSTNL